MDRKNFYSELETNVATNGSTLQSETRGYQPESGVELPPPYSVENQPQQQNVWPPQAANGPDEQRGHSAAATSKADVLYSEDEIRRTQETAIRQGIAPQDRRSCTCTFYQLRRLGIMLFLIGVTLLIVLCVLIVRPAVNDMQLKSAQCTVISSDVTADEERTCRCGRNCKSYYRCLRIRVTFHANGKKQTAYLYENVYSVKNTCSTQPCSARDWKGVESFRRDYGQLDSKYTCYYNPKALDEVFTIRSSMKSNEMAVVHCILWPMLLIAFSIGMFGTLFCRAKGHCCFRKRNGAPVQNTRTYSQQLIIIPRQ